ncbi:unnamed protein product [Prunus brigantina]
MDQCDDLMYRFKQYNADKKLNLNFLQDPPPLPKEVTEEMVEAYKGEDADVESSSETDSSCEEEGAELQNATVDPPEAYTVVAFYPKYVVQHIGALISTGMTISVLNAKENGVSPVDLRYDVLMAHNAYSSISD